MNNVLCNGFVINPSAELVPKIRISPFKFNSDFDKNEDTNITQRYFYNRFGEYCLFRKAREIIYYLLKKLELNKEDIVTIYTTSNNFYISSCVTNEIEKVCKWNREFTDETKVIFINHEFGYPLEDRDYKDIVKIKENFKDIIIIEDCAHTFFSNNQVIGKFADYIIYSLPKSFPVQLGAILVKGQNTKKNEVMKSKVTIEEERYLLLTLSPYIRNLDNNIEKQMENFLYLKEHLKKLGIEPYFSNRKLDTKVCVPNVFLFKWLDNIDYPSLKVFMQRNGVESSVFYGDNGFFIPCNYMLSRKELNYMIELLTYFYNYHMVNLDENLT